MRREGPREHKPSNLILSSSIHILGRENNKLKSQLVRQEGEVMWMIELVDDKRPTCHYYLILFAYL